MIWRRLGIFIDALWTDLMLELERNPLAVRQGAAAVACIAAAAIAMPVISHRAAEQRDGAEWTARNLSFETHMQAQLIPGFAGRGRVELASYNGHDAADLADGMLFNDGRRQTSPLRAALRGPFETPPVLMESPAAADELDQKELGCLSQAVYYEARSESVRGQVAVGEVVMNRVRSPYYPKSICGVVYQGHERASGCQFTFTCDGSLNRRPGGRAWERAQHIAAQVMLGYTRSVVGSSTHYHTVAVSPAWRPMLVETMRLGDHVFYRLPNRTERAVLEQASLQRRAAAAARAAAPEAPVPDVPAAIAPPATPVSAHERPAAPKAPPAAAPEAVPAPERAVEVTA